MKSQAVIVNQGRIGPKDFNGLRARCKLRVAGKGQNMTDLLARLDAYEQDWEARADDAGPVTEAIAELKRLRATIMMAETSLSKTVQTLNESADEQQDQRGNIVGATTLRALALLLESTCIRLRADLENKPIGAALDPNTPETAPPE